MKEKLNKMLKRVTIGLFILLFAILTLAKCSSSGGSTTNTETTTTTTAETTTKPAEESKPEEKKIWKPSEVAEFNHPYRSTDFKNPDGSYLILNVESVKKRDGAIVITSYAPSNEAIKYALDNFMAMDIFDEEGETLSPTLDNITTNPIPEDGIEIIITGIDTTKAKWVEIMPYKTINNEFITFELK